jgi:hypothetical protein
VNKNKNGRAADDPRERAQIGPRQMKDPRSVDFAWQTVAFLKRLYQGVTTSEKRWRDVLAEADHYRIYERVPPEKPYGSLDALLRAEVGADAEESVRVVRNRAQQTEAAQKMAADPDVTPLAEHGEIGRGRNRGSTTTSNGTRGAEYWIRRLKKDAPEHAKLLAQRKYASAHEAAKAAGLMEDRRLSLSADAAAAAALIRRRFGDEFARELARELQKPR